MCPFTLTLERAVSECNREDLDLRNRPKGPALAGNKGLRFQQRSSLCLFFIFPAASLV